MRRNSLFNELSSIGDTVYKGLVAPAEFDLQNKKLDLETKKTEFDISRGRQADKLALERAGREEEAHNLGKPRMEAEAAEWKEKEAKASMFVKATDLFGHSVSGLSYAYAPDESGETPIHKIMKATGTVLDTDQESDTIGHLINVKTGKPVTWREFDRYTPQVDMILEANADPVKFLKMTKDNLADDLYRGKITKPEYDTMIKELGSYDNEKAHLKAYEQKLQRLTGFKGVEADKARARTEAKIAEIRSRVAKAQDSKQALADKIAFEEKKKQLGADEYRQTPAEPREAKINQIDLKRAETLLDEHSVLSRAIQGLSKDGKVLDTPLTTIEKEVAKSRIKEIADEVNRIKTGGTASIAPVVSEADAMRKLGITPESPAKKDLPADKDLKAKDKRRPLTKEELAEVRKAEEERRREEIRKQNIAVRKPINFDPNRNVRGR